MKKRVCSIMLCLVMVMSLLPTVALATNEPTPATSVTVGGVELDGTEGKTYWKNGNDSTSDATGTADDWNAKFEGGTLTLKDAVVTGADRSTAIVGNFGIYASGDLTVTLEGGSTVTAGVSTGTSAGIYIVNNETNGTLTITGTGSLTAVGDEAENSYGVYGLTSVQITGGSITAAGGTASNNSYGVYSDRNVTVSGTATKLVAVGGKSSSPDSYGSSGVRIKNSPLNTPSALAVEDGAQVVAVGGEVAENGTSYGVCTPTNAPITYTDGLLVAKGNTSAMNKAATGSGVDNLLAGDNNDTSKYVVFGDANTYYVPAGNVTSETENVTDHIEWSGNDLTLTNTIIIGADNDSNAYAALTFPAANCKLTNKGYNVMLGGNKGKAGYSCGVYVTYGGELLIDGDGALTAIGASGGQSGGVWGGSKTTLSGTVTAIGNHYGVYSYDRIIINGGSGAAIGGSGTKGQAMNNTPTTSGVTTTDTHKGKAMTWTSHTHCVCGGNVNAGDHTSHNNISYTPWDGTTPITYTDNVANIYLTKDLDLSKVSNTPTPNSAQTLNLCLNGHKLFRSANNDTYVIQVYDKNSTVNVCDCSTKHRYGQWVEDTTYQITDTSPESGEYDTLSAGVMTQSQNFGAVENRGTFNLYGGSIAGNHACSSGGVSNGKKGTFNLYGGSIVGNHASSDGGGGVGNSGIFNLYGGSIKNNRAKFGGGGVYIYSGGTFNLSGGSIENNRTDAGGGGVYINSDSAFNLSGGSIKNNYASNQGGGVYSFGTFSLSGGSIKDNHASSQGGGVYSFGTFNLSGAPVISGNASSTKRSNDTVYLSNYSNSCTINIVGALTNTTPIGLRMSKPATFTSGTAVTNSTYLSHFTSESAAYKILTDGTQLKLAVIPEITVGEKQEVTAGSSSDLTITSNADLADFERVEVGKAGETPTALTENTDYTKTAGSTIITLKNNYLKTLAAGTYTLNIVSKAGTASTTFIIQPSSGGSSGGSSYNYYDIKITKEGSGTISPDGGGDAILTIREQKDQLFTFTPDEGYMVSDVLADGKSVGAQTSYTFEKISKDHTLKVIFEPSSKGHVNPETGVPFEDVQENDWFVDSVYDAVNNGWLHGTSKTTFEPTLSTTRGMIATVLWRVEQEPSVAAASIFEDVASGLYYTDAVNWAQKNGIVVGYGDGTFGPEDNITREQMAAILYRYAQFKGYDVSKTASLNHFTDGTETSDYAKTPMAWAVANGLILGKENDSLDPNGNAIRAEVAAILMRFDALFSKK